MSAAGTVVPVTVDVVAELPESSSETCDRCGPSVRAAVRVQVGGSGFPLTFCGHCYRTRLRLI